MAAKEVEASVARCLRTPPDGAYPVRTLRSVFQTALRSLGNRSIVVVGNYGLWPITLDLVRAKARPLRPRRSYFGPTETPQHRRREVSGKLGWSRRVLPP